MKKMQGAVNMDVLLFYQVIYLVLVNKTYILSNHEKLEYDIVIRQR